jgi:cytochrome c oxidase subunit 4
MAEHIISRKTYLYVFLTLLLLTGVTTGAAFIDLGSLSVAVALAIAVAKMLLVALFFMHVLYSRRLTQVTVGGGLMWLAILLLLTMTDFVTRSWLGVPGK